jgi:hypothetical protein
MAVFRLLYPVHTLQGQQLLPADTLVSEETLIQLIATSKDTLQKRFSLLNYKNVKDDLFQFMNSDPYRIIFADKETTTAVVNLMEKVSLPQSILESLD